MYLPFSTFRWILLFSGLALLIIGAELIVIQSSAFSRQPDWISMGIAVDMLVVIPVFYYTLIVRKLKISARSLLGVFGVTLSLTALILPKNNQNLIVLLQQSLLLLDLFFVGYALVRIHKIINHYQQLSLQTVDFTENLLQSLNTTLGNSRFNRILVSELSILRYGLLGWWIPVEKRTTDKAFSSHQESGKIALTIGLVLVGLIEIVILHLFINRWSTIVAWSATAISFYGLLFFIADLIATIKRPILIQGNLVVFRFGLRGYGVVEKRLIEQVKTITDKPERTADTMNGAFLTTPNLLITVREPVLMTGPLGIQRSVSRVALFIDDKQQFIQELTA